MAEAESRTPPLDQLSPAARATSTGHYPHHTKQTSLCVHDMDVVSQGRNAKVFTVPMISWEPLINLSNQPIVLGDPPFGVNYYQNDGGPTQILNNGDDTVTLAPLPLTDYLVDRFEQDDQDSSPARS
jgi:hypothetical protein